ncbi:PREDICTED: uncharacterized protein LOC105453073 isoform X1 [Wasmannia auropunctata]|uniref:uncharacterized protein LOC105453073 isoform X1 n=1 Tax=Wasmannia auropunctata TaxID=64793 RepID=UPI0005EFD869|nr:PREDICTED: uncharacterized protein LOC105453073 isoform X1 [Wasmannia auropunctata]
MEPTRILLLIVLLGAVNCQNGTIITSEVLQDYDPKFMVGCYFPAEFQGEFVTQVSGKGAGGMANEPIQYSTINITFNAIPVWGFCHKRVGDNVLLIDRNNDKDCIRCFRLLRRSRNVIEVFSEALNRCYIYESAALASCGTLNSTSILYRSKEIGGSPIRNEYCPIVGLYHFKYSINNNSAISFECSTFSSEFNNCGTDGSVLHLKFKRCNFEARDISYKCLGSWDGPNNSRYFALWNSNADDGSPQYRCGLYHIDNKRGKTYMAFSSDSSCTQNLDNSTNGYETLVLSKSLNQKTVPEYVRTHVATFPKWAQGLWEESLIVNGTMTFTDLNGYNSYTFITVESNEETGRYVVYSKDQCEHAAFVCLMMRQRSENVLEFTLALSGGTGMILNPAANQNEVCEDPNMDNAVWMTQARIERVVESPCPITGQYTGEITDLSGMCAELSSNCNTREIMYYKVSDCESGELYEERTYLCLGQWEEKGVMYTYTMRNDTATNECFVGLIVNDEEIYIKEAGDHCIRNIDPKTQGMRLYKKGQCYGNSPSPAPTPMKPIPLNPIMRITTTPRSRLSETTRVPGNAVSASALCRSTTPTTFMLLVPVIVAFFKIASPYSLE